MVMRTLTKTSKMLKQQNLKLKECKKKMLKLKMKLSYLSKLSLVNRRLLISNLSRNYQLRKSSLTYVVALDIPIAGNLVAAQKKKNVI
jgi:hypothetical protein